MILRFLPEENEKQEMYPPPNLLPPPFPYGCKVGLIDRYFNLFLSPVNSSFLDKWHLVVCQ